MADKEEHIEEDIINNENVKIDNDVSEESTPHKKSSRKKGDADDKSEGDLSTDTPILDENSKTTFKRKSKSNHTETPSEMLVKIENSLVTEPPIRVPRVKKAARKKAAKVNTKTINRVVRFF